MRTSGLLVSALVVVGVAACGGKAKGPVSNAAGGGGGGGGGGERLPWEAALTTGATFTLAEDIGEGDGEPVTVKVTAVEADGLARVYRLDWGEGGNGPSEIRVEGTTVTINGAEPAAMQPPWAQENSDAMCYGEDMSNPEGCEDICDAHLCLSPTAGIVSVFGLYAPGYSSYSAR